ncbi:DapH/DapD/GlmU-related protein [Chroococcus sp. FPU101]|uniref:acyltransferase n=1 Tax=Chroococcus sp. FPU101 TaxID=1974212 RepID=UPI001AA6EEAF|nr:acyltransferase [Chroococcus sp. FPU101]GFE69606.1 transferase hexapeptide repeat containing protein [Chroococcus sp. FPU101]
MELLINKQSKWHFWGIQGILTRSWMWFWMRFSGQSFLGRVSTFLATWCAPPYYERRRLASYHRRGYIAPNATIYHRDLQLGNHIFIGDRVLIYQDKKGGKVKLNDRVHLYGDLCIQTGEEGSLTIGADSHIQPRCQFSAYKAPIQIGCSVQIGSNCAFYSYNHGIAPDKLIKEQPLITKGGITIEDDVWLGYGVIVLDGVHIGKGAVIGAGSVVTHSIPENAIAVGVPARVVKMRHSLDLALVP